MVDQPMLNDAQAAAVPGEQRDFHRHLTQAVLWPAVAMLVLSAVFLGLIGLLLNSARWVEHSDQVIAQLHQVEKLLVDRETGLRGYLLTGNPDFLEPYSAASTALPAALDRLAAQVADNPVQGQHLALLMVQRAAWNEFVRGVLSSYERGGDYRALVQTGIGKAHMDAMRQTMAAMLTMEERLRAQRRASAEQTTFAVAGGSLLLAVLLGGALAWLTRRQLLALAQRYGALLAATAHAAQRLQTLHQIDQAILGRRPLPETVGVALQHLGRLVGAPRAVGLWEPLERQGWVRLVVGPGRARSEVLPDPPEGLELFGPVGTSPPPLLSSGEALRRAPLAAAPLAEAHLPQALIARLGGDGDCCGLLALGLPAGTALPSDTATLIREVADQLTIAIQQERLRRDLARHTAGLEQRVAQRTAALEAANAELEAFGYTVAHDLRAPVRAMQGFAAALLEDYGERLDQLGREYAQRILSAGADMEQLIRDLLDYSRLSRAELSFSAVALEQALGDALAQIQAQIEARAAAIRVDGPLPSVRGHRTTLAQVLANLLANAMTFVAAGQTPHIRVRAGVADGWARLEVQDNGIGIAPEHQERIFRVFERLHSAEQYPGTGIGLAIVRKGVERMGGRTGLLSAPDAGSTFWIELPAMEGGQ